jgi:hypothetical protein
MTHYNLVKLAEDVKDKKPGIIPGALGAGALLASGYDSIRHRDRKEEIEGLGELVGYNKMIKMMDDGKYDDALKHAMKLRNSDDVSGAREALAQLHENADDINKVNAGVKDIYNNEASRLDKFLIGKKKLEDTDDAAEHALKLIKRRNLLNKAGYAAGAAGLGYGAYKYLNRDKNS